MKAPLALPAAPWWLPGGDAQTVWSAVCARRQAGPPPQLTRERWDCPDGDFIEVDFLAREGAGVSRPLLVLFHGLEGSAQSHYAQVLAVEARLRGWSFAVPHFRGCAGEPNRAPRAYHSGDHPEIDWILRRMKGLQARGAPLLVVGVSLGGNALLRWAGEQGAHAAEVVSALAAVSAPVDLAAAGRAIDHGFNRWVYAAMFLRTMRRKAVLKWRQYPGLFDLDAACRATTLRAFDDAFTAPLHGFAGVDDYWRRASAKPVLPGVRVPALVLNARNDPFVPAESLPLPAQVSDWVTLCQPDQGGHVGFTSVAQGGAWPGHVRAMPQAVADWLARASGVQ